jgi:predicted RNA methylase
MFGLLAIGLGLALAVAPLAAHHSFEAEYDAEKTANLKGAVTKIEWANPHAHVFMNVEDKNGKVSTYTVELGPPYALVRGGWQRSTVNIGDTITMENVALAKDGSNKAGATRDSVLVLASGEKKVLR